jgi:hypothetical protein
MRWKATIVHEPDDEGLAVRLAKRIEAAGYDVHSDGSVLPGESYVEEMDKAIGSGGPVILCGTKRAVGAMWVSRILHSARAHLRSGSVPAVRVFAVKLEAGANLALLTGDGIQCADCSLNFELGVDELINALTKHFPLVQGKISEAFELTSDAIPFLDQPVSTS